MVRELLKCKVWKQQNNIKVVAGLCLEMTKKYEDW